MKKMFRERNPLPLGLIVVTWLLITVMVILNINTIIGSFGRQYYAELAEAAGLKQGDPVRVSGLKVGRVSSVELGGEGVIVEFAVTNDDIVLADDTTARVAIATVLGDKALVLTSAGSGSLGEGDTIPLARTSVPYDVTEALSELTTETGRIDVDLVADALDSVSATLEASGPELRSAVEGVGRLSETIAARDDNLRSLLDHADEFSAVLADRSETLTSLVKDANLLFAELVARRADIESLLVNVSAMSRQLTGFVADNRAQLRPALQQLNKVLTMLRENKQNIDQALEGVATYATGLGEVVGSGPFFSAILENLLPGNFFPPTVGRVAPQIDGAGR